MLQKPKSGGFRGISGNADPRLIKKAEDRLGYSAIYVIGEVEDDKETGKYRIGLATNPLEIFKTAQQWNWRNIVVKALIWTDGPLWSAKLKRQTEIELEPFQTKGSWYELPPVRIINAIVAVASTLGCEIFSDLQRYERYEIEIEKAVKQRTLLAKVRQKVIPFRRPTR